MPNTCSCKQPAVTRFPAACCVWRGSQQPQQLPPASQPTQNGNQARAARAAVRYMPPYSLVAQTPAHDGGILQRCTSEAQLQHRRITAGVRTQDHSRRSSRRWEQGPTQPCRWLATPRDPMCICLLATQVVRTARPPANEHLLSSCMRPLRPIPDAHYYCTFLTRSRYASAASAPSHTRNGSSSTKSGLRRDGVAIHTYVEHTA